MHTSTLFFRVLDVCDFVSLWMCVENQRTISFSSRLLYTHGCSYNVEESQRIIVLQENDISLRS